MALKDLLEKREKEYKAIKEVYCPVLRCRIHFNKKGWEHLRYHGNHRKRTRQDLARRLSLFPNAVKIISSHYCSIRTEPAAGLTNVFLQKGKITVMLQKKDGSKVIYYYSIFDT